MGETKHDSDATRSPTFDKRTASAHAITEDIVSLAPADKARS